MLLCCCLSHTGLLVAPANCNHVVACRLRMCNSLGVAPPPLHSVVCEPCLPLYMRHFRLLVPSCCCTLKAAKHVGRSHRLSACFTLLECACVAGSWGYPRGTVIPTPLSSAISTTTPNCIYILHSDTIRCYVYKLLYFVSTCT